MFDNGIWALNVVLPSPLWSCPHPKTVTGQMKVS